MANLVVMGLLTVSARSSSKRTTKLVRRVATSSLFVMLLCAGSLAPAKPVPALFGIVLNSLNIGVSGITVRVTRTDNSGNSFYASTDSRGAFEFRTLLPQMYVLDVIDGHKLLHRSSIELPRDRRTVIKLAQMP